MISGSDSQKMLKKFRQMGCEKREERLLYSPTHTIHLNTEACAKKNVGPTHERKESGVFYKHTS